MFELIKKIYNFIFTLRLQIKVMSEKEFAEFIKELDYQQTIYAMYIRYF